MAHRKTAPEYNVMDGSSTTDNSMPERDHLLYHLGHAYRFLLLGDATASCFHQQKLGSGERYRAVFEEIARTPAMRHRLWLEALYWAAYFGEGVGHDHLGWLVKQIVSRRLGWYEVICTGPHRGEPKPPENKQPVLATTPAATETPTAEVLTSVLTAVIGIVAGRVPGGKWVAKAVGKGMSKNASKELGEATSQKKAQDLIGEAREPRFTPRTPGPDDMTNTKALTEWESKVTKDNRVRVATDKKNRKQGSAPKNETYAKKMLTKRKKVGKPSNRIGGPYTPQEMDLWQEVKDKDGEKVHMLVHTNSETGVVRVFKQDSQGNFDPKNPVNQFELGDFAALKKKLMEDYP